MRNHYFKATVTHVSAHLNIRRIAIEEKTGTDAHESPEVWQEKMISISISS